MSNENTVLSKNGYTLDDESIKLFWSNINEEIKSATKKSSYEPTKFLEYNNEKYFMKAINLITWLKMAFPKSAIQTEKIICDDTKCQYNCKIWLNPIECSIPTSCEGKLVRVDNSTEFTNEENYVSTAQTMAIVKCMQYLGFALHINDDYYVEYRGKSNNNQPNKSQKNDPVVIQSIEDARNCPVMYVQRYTGQRSYENRPLGDVQRIDIRFFRSIPMKKSIDEYTKQCVNYILNYKE